MSEAKSSENKDALKMLTIALEQTQKKDKLGLMDSIKNLATISQSLSAIHKALPMINHLINLIVW